MKLARQVAVVLRDGQARGERAREAPDRGFHSSELRSEQGISREAAFAVSEYALPGNIDHGR